MAPEQEDLKIAIAKLDLVLNRLSYANEDEQPEILAAIQTCTTKLQEMRTARIRFVQPRIISNPTRI